MTFQAQLCKIVFLSSINIKVLLEYARNDQFTVQEVYVTANNSGVSGFAKQVFKIATDPDSFELVTSDVQAKVQSETDEEIVERLRNRFFILDEMTRACKRGDVRAMIVSGPPGVGKSFGVERVLSKHDLLVDLTGDSSLRKYEIVKGAMSPIMLYCKLYQYRQPDSVVVFDDCDSVLLDDVSLNILKAALDSGKTRRIYWNTDSRVLAREQVPDSFDFNGSAIFITNIKFDQVRSKKLQGHLEALESRCHYIDLTINTDREKMLRIHQIVQDGMLEAYNFSPELINEIIDFIGNNKHRLREISLRTVLKVADLARAFPLGWAKMAEITVMRK